MSRAFGVALIAASAISLARPAPAPADELPTDVFAASPADAVLDVVILADDHPVVVRLRVEIGGVGYRRAFDDFLVRLHAHLDADRDGLLSPEEAGRGDWASLFAERPFDRVQNPSGSGSDGDADDDGRVSLDELGTHVRAAMNVDPASITGGPPPDSRTERAFGHLDRDGDGRLDASELALAGASLAALDRDEDEWVVLDEMNPYSSNTRQFFGGRGDGSQVPSGHPFAPLTEEDDRAALARRLLDRYDRDGDGRLDAGELGLPSDAVAPLDADALAGWLSDPTPHLELKASLYSPRSRLVGNSRGPMKLERLAVAEALADRLGPPSDATQVLDLGPLVVELGISSSFSDFREFLLTNFKSGDGDSNGYLDRDEANRTGILGQIHEVADRDGDGKLFERELVSYLDLFDAAYAARISASIADRGRSVFQAIDPDGDLRLGPRERLGLPNLLAGRDRDGDGMVSLEEFPRRYALSIGLGPGGNSNQVIFAESGSGRRPDPSEGDAPSWFRRMDRNGDGDVSRREFLGPLDLFDRLDRDGDGLVSAEDAKRAVR